MPRVSTIFENFNATSMCKREVCAFTIGLLHDIHNMPIITNGLMVLCWSVEYKLSWNKEANVSLISCDESFAVLSDQIYF